jgi:hypothetical protein
LPPSSTSRPMRSAPAAMSQCCCGCISLAQDPLCLQASCRFGFSYCGGCNRRRAWLERASPSIPLTRSLGRPGGYRSSTARPFAPPVLARSRRRGPVVMILSDELTAHRRSRHRLAFCGLDCERALAFFCRRCYDCSTSLGALTPESSGSIGLECLTLRRRPLTLPPPRRCTRLACLAPPTTRARRRRRDRKSCRSPSNEPMQVATLSEGFAARRLCCGAIAGALRRLR